MIKNRIKEVIERSIKELQQEGVFPEFTIPEIEIENTPKEIIEDYSSNIAMLIVKDVKKDPSEIANLINEKFEKDSLSDFGKISSKVEKPGFINFIIPNDYLKDKVKTILKEKEKYGRLDIGKGKKVQVEFISANPTGPLTVGNARGGPFGDVLANIFKKAGFKIEKAYYINDYGNQILTLGHSVLKDEEAVYKGGYIDELSEEINEEDPFKAGEKAVEKILEMIKKTVKDMGIEYDEWFSEKKLHKGEIDKVINLLTKKGFTYEEDGALWFKSSDLGDIRDRVLIKTNKDKTYLAGDIAYHYYKFNKKKFDKVINIWGADHFGDVSGLEAGVDAIGYKGQLDTILLQFITLFKGKEKLKMSKRSGTYVTMDELLDEVGKDVVRFFFLQRSADRHLNFDLFVAKQQSEKNPVYYVQYAHARMCGILRKSGEDISNCDFSKLEHKSELELIKHLIRFPEIIEETINDYQIQRVPQYAIDLAKSFSGFYRDCQVVTEKDEEMRKTRIALLLASRIVLRNCLGLIGVGSPEKM